MEGGIASAAQFAALPPARQAREVARLEEDVARALLADWRFWARPAQLAPPGDWRVWLLMAGRGFGKTRAGAEWVRGVAETDPRARIALVAATPAEARRVMVEGPSGLLAIAPPHRRPRWEPSLRRLRWPGGAEARCYGASDPDSLRGPQHSHGWADEIAKWPFGEETWDMLAMGLRLGKRPRAVATTTPRPVPLLRALLAREDVAVTRGATAENSALAEDFLAGMAALYGGTRLGRQELDGALIEEAEGALWPRALIDRCRVRAAPAELTRIVVAVDPPAGVGRDACGIVAAGRAADGIVYVLADASLEGASPAGWARAVAETAAAFGSGGVPAPVVAEANQGGAMVEAVLHAAGAGLSVRLVHARHGKAARAEPAAMLYAAGRVRHVGAFPALEDEMAGFTVAGWAGARRSPDRADALVWALAALCPAGVGMPSVRGL